MSGFDLAQTFFIDQNAVGQAASVYITSIDLFFQGKPVQGQSQSGIYSPGVTLYIGDTLTDNSPNVKSYKRDVFARVEWDNINVSETGDVATTFTFSRPLNLRTNTTAAFLIKFDGNDRGFTLFQNKSGSYQVGTTTRTSVTSSKVDGNLFAITNGTTLTPQRDADMSFRMRIAKFSTSPVTYKIKNRAYEILKINSLVGNFIGGEDVYVQGANAAGTVDVKSISTTLTGVGTSFTALTAGDSFVITDGTAGNTEVRTVASVTNTTVMTLTVAPSFTNTVAHFYKSVTGKLYFSSGQSDHLIIQDSTANSTVYLAVSNKVLGVDSQASANIAEIQAYNANALTPGFVVGVPKNTTINTTIGFASSNLAYSSGNERDVSISERQLINKHPAIVASRTTEVTTASPFKSVQSTLKFQTTNPYVSPYVDEENLDLFLETFEINNDDTNEYLGNGNAKTRYISQTVNLGADQLAEDIKVYITAYKPANTDIKVYARFRNSSDIETLEVKNWTELVANTTGIDYSSSTDIDDYKEIGYDVAFQPTGTLQTGQFVLTTGNTIVTSSSTTVNTGIAIGDVVKIYSSYFANTYLIATVLASNTTTFTMASSTANTSLLNTGLLVDVVTRKNSAFLDAQDQNTITYYNSALSLFKGFDSFALKIVLLSDNNVSIPYVDDIRAIAVSA